MLEKLPRDVLRLIVDGLEPVDYFRLKKCSSSLYSVLRRYLSVSPSEWSDMWRKQLNGLSIRQWIMYKRSVADKRHLDDFLRSFRIDPRQLSRKDLKRIIISFWKLMAMGLTEIHIGKLPIDRKDRLNPSYDRGSFAPYIASFGTYLIKSSCNYGHTRMISRQIAGAIVASAVVLDDVRLVRVFLTEFWYNKIRGDILMILAIVCQSWKCLYELFSRYQTKEVPLKVLSQFKEGHKSKHIVDLVVRGLNTWDASAKLSHEVLASLLMHYSNCSPVLEHRLWNLLTDEKIALVFAEVMAYHETGIPILKSARCLLSLPNACYKNNLSYVSSAIATGNVALLKHLLTLGCVVKKEEWLNAEIMHHPPRKRRHIRSMFGFPTNDSY